MKISGHLDLCGPTLIEGWLHCDAWQDEPIRLQVYLGGELVGECAADRFRQDLQDAGFGNGRCGFSFQMPEDSGVTDFTTTRLRLVGSPVYLLPNEYTSVAQAQPDHALADPEHEPDADDTSAGKTYEMADFARHAGGGGRQDLSFRTL